MKGKLFSTVESYQVTNIGGKTGLENHHFATTIVIINIGKNYQWILKLLCEILLKNSVSIKAAEEGMEKREPSCTVGGNVNWYSHYGEQYGGSLKKLKIELPYDPEIPLLGIYPEKTIIQKDTCTPMFQVMEST